MKVRMFVAAAGSAALLAAPAAWAGQAGTVDESVNETVVTNGIVDGITVGGIEITHEDTSETAYAITNSIDNTAITLSLQVFEDGYHGFSPAGNIASFGDAIDNLIESVDGTGGITTVQQAGGQANVSVSHNSLLDASALGAVDNLAAGPDAAEAATIAWTLNPAFTLANSKQAAQALAILALGDALATTGTAFGDLVTAIEFVSEDSYELSPEGNIAEFAGAMTNTISAVSGTTGLTTVQQSGGQANVQASFNTILFSADSAGDALAPIIP
jgi:hypothetical protein